jgi:hypothetical protein
MNVAEHEAASGRMTSDSAKLSGGIPYTPSPLAQRKRRFLA